MHTMCLSGGCSAHSGLVECAVWACTCTQSRLGMYSPGAPVLGDALYADAAAAAREQRAYLHAAALRLPASRALVSADDLDAMVPS